MFRILNKQLRGLVDVYVDLHGFYQENQNLIVSNDLKIKDVISAKHIKLGMLWGDFDKTLKNTVAPGATITNIEFNRLLENVNDAKCKYVSLKKEIYDLWAINNT